MADATPAKRVLPARQRRESTAKRRASSPPAVASKPATPASKSPATPATDESKPKRKYEKRIKTVHLSTPTRSASTPTSTGEEILPTKVTSSRPLPCSSEKQPEDLSVKQFQSIADSAILAASLHRSRMQWLCEGIFKKYWTKPVRRKKVVEEPPGNPDVKTMQKLGAATITIEPHTFDATFYVVREPQVAVPAYKPPQPIPQVVKPPPPSLSLPPPPPAATTSSVAPAPPKTASTIPGPAASTVSPAPNASQTPTSQAPAATPPVSPAPNASQKPPSQAAAATPPASTPTPAPARPATPPGGPKTTDPVIQMLAHRAATDNHLKELMKVVATSKASPEQLREFQAHIDEFNAIAKKQEAEREARAKLASASATSASAARAAHPSHYNTPHRNSPLNPQYASYSMQPRTEPAIKHVIVEFTSPPAAGQSANTDRWLFPEYAVLDTQYGGTEMTCSFFVERKGSDILASFKDLTSEEMQAMSSKWNPEVEYFQPITMVIKANQHRTIETIARSAKSLPEVQKHMQHVMENKSRSPQEFLVYRLPREKVDNSVEFVDSGVDMSGEDDELRDFYPL